MNLSKKYNAKLIFKSVETPSITTFVFSVDQEFEYVPGQYIFLEIPKFEMKRPFSILNYNKAKKELTLGIKKHGEFTGKLGDLELGTAVFINGPYGRFSTNNKKVVFIAGGIGITPIYNLIINRKNKNDFLFYSAKSEEEMAFLKDFLKLNLNKKLFFTNKKSDKGLNCRITADIIIDELKKNKENIQDYEFMICGPTTMISALRQQLVAAGINNEKIKNEVF